MDKAELRKKMVDRFLAWPLPDSVCSDPCATMLGYPHRSGTNLLTAPEAETMLAHVVEPLLDAAIHARDKATARLQHSLHQARAEWHEEKKRARESEEEIARLKAKLERAQTHHRNKRLESDQIEQTVFDRVYGELEQARAERDAAVDALQDIYAQASICDGDNAKLRHEWVRERCRETLAQLPHAAPRARLVEAVVAAGRDLIHACGPEPEDALRDAVFALDAHDQKEGDAK